jgi:hypothetical protein
MAVLRMASEVSVTKRRSMVSDAKVRDIGVVNWLPSY